MDVYLAMLMDSTLHALRREIYCTNVYCNLSFSCLGNISMPTDLETWLSPAQEAMRR